MSIQSEIRAQLVSGPKSTDELLPHVPSCEGGFMVACALVGRCFVNTYSINISKADDLEEAADRAGVDSDEIRRLIMAAAKKGASPPKPAAQARSKAAAKAKPAVGEEKANGASAGADPAEWPEGRDAALSRRVPSHDGLCPDGGAE